VIYKRLNDFGIKLEDPWAEIRRMGVQSARKEKEKLKKKYSTKKLFEMALSFTLENKLEDAINSFEIVTEIEIIKSIICLTGMNKQLSVQWQETCSIPVG